MGESVTAEPVAAPATPPVSGAWREGDPAGRRRFADLGTLRLETGVPEVTQKRLATMGWKLGASDGGFGGYQAILKGPQAYAAATEMRKDGVALAF